MGAVPVNLRVVQAGCSTRSGCSMTYRLTYSFEIEPYEAPTTDIDVDSYILSIY